MRSVYYARYMRSSKWFAVRRRYFARHPEVCAACGTMNHIHLHHRTYEHLGREYLRDLVALCETCHKKVHRYARTHRNMTLWAATTLVIKGIRTGQTY